jgi:hypothetical protein
MPRKSARSLSLLHPSLCANKSVSPSAISAVHTAICSPSNTDNFAHYIARRILGASLIGSVAAVAAVPAKPLSRNSEGNRLLTHKEHKKKLSETTNRTCRGLWILSARRGEPLTHARRFGSNAKIANHVPPELLAWVLAAPHRTSTFS